MVTEPSAEIDEVARAICGQSGEDWDEIPEWARENCRKAAMFIARVTPPTTTCAGHPCRRGDGCRNPWCPFTSGDSPGGTEAGGE